jgi:hypothetical protein
MRSRRHPDRDIDADIVAGPEHEAAGVVFVKLVDIEAFGLSAGGRVDLVSEFTNGDGELQERRAKDLMVVAYSTPRGNAAAYCPETNTPVSKPIVIRLEPA